MSREPLTEIPIPIHSATFVKSAPSLKDSPDFGGLPEFVMVGRSNVGKSSLINSLLNRKSLAKTSNTPGKTRLINFYLINQQWVLVDLPGYGYAKVSHAEQARWQKNLEQYLTKREPICVILILIDARHPLQASDEQMITWLSHHQLPWQIVLTKTDKLSKNQVGQHVQQLTKALRPLGASPERILPYSAVTHVGRPQLWERLLSACGQSIGSPAPATEETESHE
jgi:GTP-binding protein